MVNILGRRLSLTEFYRYFRAKSLKEREGSAIRNFLDVMVILPLDKSGIPIGKCVLTPIQLEALNEIIKREAVKIEVEIKL